MNSITSSPPVPQLPPDPPAIFPSSSPNPSPAPVPQHSMITHARNNIIKPKPRYGLASVVLSDVEPNTVSQALSDPRWREAMSVEFIALLNNSTCDLVPPHAT